MEVLKFPLMPLPTSNVAFDVWYGMGFDNISNILKIVCVAKNHELNFEVAHVYVLGTSSSWSEIDSIPCCGLSDKNVSAHRDMHWLVRENKEESLHGNHIFSFDFKKEKFNCTYHPNLDGFLHFDDMHLLNIRGCLAIMGLSFSSSRSIKIWVLKDYSKKEWTLDYKIATLMFITFVRPCGEWEHGITFRKIRGSCLLLYNIKQVTLETLFPSVSNFIYREAPYRLTVLSTRCFIVILQVSSPHNTITVAIWLKLKKQEVIFGIFLCDCDWTSINMQASYLIYRYPCMIFCFVFPLQYLWVRFLWILLVK